MYSDSDTYLHCNVGAVLSLIEHTKKTEHSQSAEMINASFTPFFVTADGALGHEAMILMCVQGCFLLSFMPQICAFVAVE